MRRRFRGFKIRCARVRLGPFSLACQGKGCTCLHDGCPVASGRPPLDSDERRTYESLAFAAVMASLPILSTIALALALAVSGCAGPSPTPTKTAATTTSPAAGGTCNISLKELPAHPASGNWSLKVAPTCSFSYTSDHVAAHFATTSTNTPALTHYTRNCSIDTDVRSGEEVAVTCSSNAPGTFYLRGHARIMNAGTMQDYWTDEYLVVVPQNMTTPTPGSPTVHLYNMRSAAKAGAPYDFLVRVSWTVPPPGVPTNHTGAHWSNMTNATGSGSTTHYNQACAHGTGTVPGDFASSCTFTNTTTTYLRGHSRFETGGALTDFWSEELAVLIRAA